MIACPESPNKLFRALCRYVNYSEVSLRRSKIIGKLGELTEDGMWVLRWCRQTKKTPMVILPREANAESRAAMWAIGPMSLIVNMPTVALPVLHGQELDTTEKRLWHTKGARLTVKAVR